MLAVTVAFFVGARILTHSRVGTVLKSIRDNEFEQNSWVTMSPTTEFLCSALSAFMAATAGAMYAAWVGLVSFLDTGPVFSIEAVIWTAVGGRGTIIGAFVGTFLVKGAEFLLSGILASFWQLIMAALFIAVVLVFRDGIVGSIANWMGRRKRGSLSQITSDSDQTAHDRQQDWQPEGAARKR